MPDHYCFESPGGGAQYLTPKLESFCLEDGFLRLDIRKKAEPQIPATLWIDRKAKKVVRSVVNGVEMDINTGKGYAVPIVK